MTKALNPFPSSPSRPGKYELRITHAERDMFHVHMFYDVFGAKKLIDLLIGDSEYEEINETCIKTDLGIKIKCADLEKIMAHKYSKEEAAWVMPPPYDRMAQLFRGESYKAAKDEMPIPKKAVMPTARDPKVPRKPKPDGMITIQDLCAELKIDPSKARAHLRSSKTPKPDHGWAWPAKEVDAIRKVLKAVK